MATEKRWPTVPLQNNMRANARDLSSDIASRFTRPALEKLFQRQGEQDVDIATKSVSEELVVALTNHFTPMLMAEKARWETEAGCAENGYIHPQLLRLYNRSQPNSPDAKLQLRLHIDEEMVPFIALLTSIANAFEGFQSSAVALLDQLAISLRSMSVKVPNILGSDDNRLMEWIEARSVSTESAEALGDSLLLPSLQLIRTDKVYMLRKILQDHELEQLTSLAANYHFTYQVTGDQLCISATTLLSDEVISAIGEVGDYTIEVLPLEGELNADTQQLTLNLRIADIDHPRDYNGLLATRRSLKKLLVQHGYSNSVIDQWINDTAICDLYHSYQDQLLSLSERMLQTALYVDLQPLLSEWMALQRDIHTSFKKWLHMDEEFRSMFATMLEEHKALLDNVEKILQPFNRISHAWKKQSQVVKEDLVTVQRQAEHLSESLKYNTLLSCWLVTKGSVAQLLTLYEECFVPFCQSVLPKVDASLLYPASFRSLEARLQRIQCDIAPIVTDIHAIRTMILAMMRDIIIDFARQHSAILSEEVTDTKQFNAEIQALRRAINGRRSQRGKSGPKELRNALEGKVAPSLEIEGNLQHDFAPILIATFCCLLVGVDPNLLRDPDNLYENSSGLHSLTFINQYEKDIPFLYQSLFALLCCFDADLMASKQFRVDEAPTTRREGLRGLVEVVIEPEGLDRWVTHASEHLALAAVHIHTQLPIYLKTLQEQLCAIDPAYFQLLLASLVERFPEILSANAAQMTACVEGTDIVAKSHPMEVEMDGALHQIVGDGSKVIVRSPPAISFTERVARVQDGSPPDIQRQEVGVGTADYREGRDLIQAILDDIIDQAVGVVGRS